MGREVETWRDVPDWPGYRVSDQGRVRSGRQLLTGVVNLHGYEQVGLSRGGQTVSRNVHRLVARAFLGPPCGLHVDHVDGNKLNNALDNIEYVTPKENNARSYRKRVAGQRKPNLKPVDVKEIRARYANGGVSQRALADEYGMSYRGMRYLLSRETWKNV